MIYSHKITTTFLTGLLLVACRSIPKITISFEEDATEKSEAKSQPITRENLLKSGLEKLTQKPESEQSTAPETITQVPSDSISPCSSTDITESNRISLLRHTEGGKAVSCSGTYCSGATQIEVLEGVQEYLNDALFAGKEVVYQFKDGKCATFDTFSVMTSARMNFKDFEFELLVGNESPTGRFESIGKFTMDNMTLSQTFNFQPRVGRYFKVKKLTREQMDSSYTLQLWGALE